MVQTRTKKENIPFEKVPPQNIEVEVAILGSMLLDRNAIPIVIERTQPDFFYIESHVQIYKAIIQLFDENLPVDLVTLTERLRKMGALDEVGGAETLVGISNAVQTSANIDEYIRILREKYVLRSLIQTSTEIVTRCYDDVEDINVLLDEAERKIFNIVQSKEKGSGDIVSFKELIKDGITTIDKLYQNKGLFTGIKTGFHDFDEKTSGFQPSDMIVVAARPSMGKTTFALNIAEEVGVNQKKPTLIFSLEMSKAQLVQRMLCSYSRVNLHRVRRGFLSQDDWPKLVHAANQLSEAPILIDDTPSISVLDMRAKARRMKSAFDIQLIIIDYLQLMQSYDRRSENRQQEISEISRSIKSLAREINVPVIVLSQLNRAAENRPEHRPQLSDLRESGAIEQDSDVVVMLLRKEYYDANDSPGEADIIIAKQRNGPVGTVKLAFVNEITRFENLSMKDDSET
ncbi:MAG: replicative DNA helicase [Chlamydiota bacterium]|nr:replicative DNA helicase [Chlamydiota bacterium]